MTSSIADFFSTAGPLARECGVAYEPRPQQTQMASAIARSLENKSVLLVEAGTGVGKSFAYLVPAIRRLIEARHAGKPERIIIATNTIALQEQLMNKDVPLLRRVFAPRTEEGAPDLDKVPFKAELVKGRGNYISIRRLHMASSRQERLFLDEPARRSLHVIEDWAVSTSDGTLSTLPQLERAAVWDRVQSDSGNCMGRSCPNYQKCFYQEARRRMETADLLICNHAVFFADLALRSGGGNFGFLPDYHHVILDEAHQAEDVASDHFGRQLSEGRVRHLLGMLWQAKRRKGFLASLSVGKDAEATVDRAVALAESASDAADHFFESLIHFAQGEVGAVRVRRGAKVADENTLTPAFRELSIVLKRLKDAMTKDEDKLELNSYSMRAGAIADDAATLLEQSIEGCAYWIEVSASDSYGVRSTLACSPIEVAPILRKNLFTGKQSVILTSATLTTGGDSSGGAGFNHARSRLGCEDAASLLLGSPFDHATQTELHVDDAMADPRSPGYLADLLQRIMHHIDATDGGAFVLFTSFKTMHDAARLLRPELERRHMPVWVHGKDGSRTHILEQFRRDERSVLLGTSSFWQGVDVPGRGLRNVIITRLPFDPPDRPLTQARLEMIESRGGNPFMEDSLPRAVIRFKQGFGRLIRTAADTGRVVVLDPRIITARYGRLFLNALPPGVKVIRNGTPAHQTGAEEF